MKNLRRLFASIGTALASGAALAHEGHGVEGSHWHATDTWGWIALAVIAGAALWATRRK